MDDKISEHLSGHYSDDFEESSPVKPSPKKTKETNIPFEKEREKSPKPEIPAKETKKLRFFDEEEGVEGKTEEFPKTEPKPVEKPEKISSFSKPSLNFFNKSNKTNKRFKVEAGEDEVPIKKERTDVFPGNFAEKPEEMPEKQDIPKELLPFHKDSKDFDQESEAILKPREEKVFVDKMAEETELQVSYETYFMKFKAFFHENREHFSETCQKEEESLFFYDDGTKRNPPAPGSTVIKTRSKYNLKRKTCRGFMSFQSFQRVLSIFEFSLKLPEPIFKSFLENLAVFDKRNERVYYMKLLREMYRKKPIFSLLTHRFQNANPREFSFAEDPAQAASFIKARFQQYQRIRKKTSVGDSLKNIQEVQGKVTKELEDEMFKNAEEALDFIRNKVLSSDLSLREAFQAFDKNNDGKMSFFEFKAATDQAGLKLNDKIIESLFKRFDVSGKGLVSYLEFLAVIYRNESGETFDNRKRMSLFDFLNEAENILEDLRVLVRERFGNDKNAVFTSFVKENKEKITCEDFIEFVLKFTERYSRVQLVKLFDYLDKNAKKYLTLEEFGEIYEHQVQKVPIKAERKPLNQEDNQEVFKEIQKKSEKTFGFEEDARYNKEIWKGKGSQKEKLLEMESFLQILSEKTKEILTTQGKSLRDLFNMFSKDFFGYLNRLEFMKLMEFIWKDQGIESQVINEIFKIYGNEITRRISYNIFLYLINLGQKINPIYLKFKLHFGNTMDTIKTKLLEEFEKQDSQKGTGLLDFAYFERLLKANDITLTYKDRKYLKDEGFLLIKSPSETFINYRRLLSSIFPQTDQLSQEFMRRAIKTITRIRRFIKKKRQESLLLQQKLEQSQLALHSSTLRKGKAVAFKEKDKDLKENREISPLFKKKEAKNLKELRPKALELFELMPAEESRKSPMNKDKEISSSSMSLSKKSRKSSKKDAPVLKLSLKEQMQQVLPSPSKEDPIRREARLKLHAELRELVVIIAEKAVETGESLLLTKEIQQKFERRPVLKDVFLCAQDQEHEVLDIFPRSLQVSSTLGRSMMISRDSILFENDISNGSRLSTVNLASQIPLKPSKILDICFDDQENRLFCLTDKWILEVWELHQSATVPSARVRILPYKGNFTEMIEKAYGSRTHAGLFPQFLALSCNRGREILVNCSAINNSLVFFDPVSLSVSGHVYLSLKDYRLSRRLARNIEKITQNLQNLQREGRSFEELFRLPREKTNAIPCISLESFRMFLKTQFPQLANAEEIEELVNFINQKNDNVISKDEFAFLFELPRILSVKAPQSNVSLETLATWNPRINELTERSLKILRKMSEFFRKARLSPEDAFKVFDSNNSGSISIHEFNALVDQISGFTAEESEKAELIQLFDKDGSGTVEFREFFAVYSALLPLKEEFTQKNVQRNSSFSTIIEKCFEAGVDLEQEFLKKDPLLEGSLEFSDFMQVLKWLPVGLSPEEMESFLGKEAVFSDNARVNYLSLVQNSQFKQLKLRFLLKKSLIKQEDFEKLMKELDTEDTVYEQSQKIVVESVIFLESFQVFIYTTACPLSSIIYVSTTAKRFNESQRGSHATSERNSQGDGERSPEKLFENQLLARLLGHKGSFPPTIYYCEESGCLISGEKLEKSRKNIETTANISQEKQAYVPYYANIEVSKDLCADIFVWKLQESLFENFSMNPPWTVFPTHVIKQAHYDTILDFTYLPLSQLLVSSSFDRTIKFWDPVAKPHRLNLAQKHGYIRVKPGFYINPEGECTAENRTFAEVRRIYTGESVCYKLAKALLRIPVQSLRGEEARKVTVAAEKLRKIKAEKTEETLEKPAKITNRNPEKRAKSKESPEKPAKSPKKPNENPENQKKSPEFPGDLSEPRTAFYESLFALSLEKPQMIGSAYKRPGSLRSFFIERLSVEVEARFHDDLLPAHVHRELEELFFERKKKLKVQLQAHLPLLLANVQTRTVLQRETLKEVQGLLKQVSLKKLADVADSNNQLSTEIFQKLVSLPLRPKSTGRQGLSPAEVYYFLRKFNALHPFATSKETFVQFTQLALEKNHPFLADLDPSLRKPGLFGKISRVLLEDGHELRDFFEFSEETQTENYKENAAISKEKLRKSLEKLKIAFSMDELEEFWAQVDPFASNCLRFSELEAQFLDVSMEKGLRKHQRPQFLMSKLLKSLKKEQKSLLMFLLSREDGLHDGFLSSSQFARALKGAGVRLEDAEILELFESFAEKFAPQDREKVLNAGFFAKKLFAPSETLFLSHVFRTLGKIKSALLAKGQPLDYFFRDFSKDSALKIESLPVKPLLSREEFEERLNEARIPGLSVKETKVLASFLAMEQKSRETVALDVFLHYSRKTQTKLVFSANVAQFKALGREVANFLAKEKEIRQDKGEEYVSSVGEIRHLLMKYEVPNEIIDELLMRFVEIGEKTVSLDKFFASLRELAVDFEEIKSETIEKRAESPENQENYAEIQGNYGEVQGSSVKNAEKQPKKSSTVLIHELFSNEIAKKQRNSHNSLIKSYKHTENLVNFIRGQAGARAISEIHQFCEKFDDRHEGLINFSAFLNILRVILEDIPEKLLLNFANEWTLYHGKVSTNFDYPRFFENYLKETHENIEQSQQIEKEPWESVDLGSVYEKISRETHNSNINLHYALKFFDHNQTQSIPLKDFKQMLDWLKVPLSDTETRALAQDLKKPEGLSVNSDLFLKKLRLTSLGLSPVFLEKLWERGLALLSPRLIEVCFKNMEFLGFLLQQKRQKQLRNAKISAEDVEIIDAKSFFEAISELKADFSLTDAEALCKFAVIGSRRFEEKEPEFPNALNDEDLVNTQQFFQALPIMYAKSLKMRENREMEAEESQLFSISARKPKELSEDARFLLTKIRGILKDRGVSIWDAIVTAGPRIDESARIPVEDFKALLRSLDLQLSLQEKLLLVSSFAKENGGGVDLKAFAEHVESQGLSEKAIRVVLEKLAVNLFYHDMSLKTAFDCFDLNKDGKISKNEFIFGMGQLDLGLSLFEIEQVLRLIDTNRDGFIDREEFLTTFQGLFEKLAIDPVKDFSLSLLGKIKNLLTVKGADLLQCFLEYDQGNTGFVDMQGLQTVLHNFGLTNIKPFEITTLMRLFYANDDSLQADTRKTSKNSTKQTKTSTKGKKSLHFSSASHSEKVDYRAFSKKLAEIAEKNSRTQLEATNELFRKVFRLFSLKNISLFAAFVYFDVNASFTLSKLELRLGLQSLDLNLSETDFTLLWNGFSKTKGLHLRFPEFAQRFADAGALSFIKFDDFAGNLLRRFLHVAQKLGNHEEIFRKFDKNLTGQVSLAEFKDALKRGFFGFSSQEAETLFQVFCQRNLRNLAKNSPEEQQPTQFVNYRTFARVLSENSKKNQETAALAKLYSFANERGVNWKASFLKFNQSSSENKDVKARNPNDLLLQDLKKLLKSLKFRLSGEEIDLIVNNFSSNPVNVVEFEASLSQAYKRHTESSNERGLLVKSVTERLKTVIESERLQIERLFFDFDEKQQGFLDLSAVSQMFRFLKIEADKHEIKAFFQEVDAQHRNFITLAGLKAFLSETSVVLQKKVAISEEAGELLEKIKKNAQNSLENALKRLEFSGKEPLNEKTLGKLLLELGVVLQNSEISAILRKLQRDFPDKKLSIQDFADFAVRAGLDDGSNNSELPESNVFVPVQAAKILEKVLRTLEKLEISPQSLYKYLRKPHKPALSRKDLLKSLQSMDLGLLKEDLLLISQYFDEKGFGEVSEDTFVEKLQAVAGLKSLTTGSSEEFSSEIEKKSASFAVKQQAFSLLQRISSALQAKGYNHKQIRALFDRNSNGFLNREELLDGLKSLDLGIAVEKCRILAEFLDTKENGVLNVDDFLRKLHEASPLKAMGGAFKETRIKDLLGSIAQKLKKSRRAAVFMPQLVKCEKLVRPDENFHGLSRLRIGMLEADFFMVLRENGLKVSEDEQLLIKDAFSLKINPLFLDLEALYSCFESLLYAGDNEKLAEGGAEETSEAVWKDRERQIFRRIAEYLRENNLSLLSAFQCIDQDRSGLISHEEFSRFIRSIDSCSNVSDKEMLGLISSLQNPKPGFLSYNDFRDKFLSAYSSDSESLENNSNEFFEEARVLKIQELRANDRKIALRFLRKLTEIGKVEAAWVALDRKKHGIVDFTDFCQALRELGLFFTRNEAGFLFNFVDKEQDGTLSFLEIVDFCALSQRVSVLESGTDRRIPLKQLEFEIFEHLCRVLNQKEVALFAIFREIDQENKGFLTKSQFLGLLNKLGLALSAESLEELFKVFEFKQPDRVLFSDLETKLLAFGLKVAASSKIASFDFRDELLARFARKTAGYLQNINEFDEDFDGFLKPREFADFLRNVATSDFANHEIQRLSHVFKAKGERNEVEIARIRAFCEEIALKTAETGVCLVNQEIFSYLLRNFDGFGRLQTLVQEIKGKIRKVREVLLKTKEIRGLRLYGNKEICQRIAGSYLQTLIKKSLEFSLNFVKNEVCEFINNESALRILDVVKGTFETLEFLDKQAIKGVSLEINSLKPRVFRESSAFSLRNDSVAQYSPFIKIYQGFCFEISKEINAFLYEKKLLSLICRDGLRYEEHLSRELRVHLYFSQQKPGKVPQIVGVFDKKLGLDATDRELLVFHESFVKNPENTPLSQVISQIGGLLRVPFLAKTGAVGLILRLWAKEILQLLVNLQETGHILPVFSSKSFFLSKEKGGSVGLSDFRGVAQINEMGQILNIPDIELFCEQPLEKIACIAPELLEKSPLQATSRACSWAFGCLLFEILFGRPPKAFFSKKRPESMGSGAPSRFEFYDVFSEEIVEEMLELDYQRSKKNTSFLAKAIEMKDFAGIFQEVFERKFDEGLAEILNIMALCLQCEPVKRPSLQHLLRAKALKQDFYLETSAKEFAQSLQFFRSPSQSLKDRVLLPLQTLYREFSANLQGKKPKKSPLETQNIVNELLKIVETLCFAVFQRGLHNKKLDSLKKNIVVERQEPADFPSGKTPIKKSFPWILGEKRSSLPVAAENRAKLPHFTLVKFIFEHDILDLLVFLVLRTQSFDPAHSVLDACRDLFKLLFAEMSSYDTAASPYVDKILNVFVRLFIGEDTILLSEALVFSQTPKKNKQISQDLQKNSRTIPGDSSLFRSLLWTPNILSSLGNLFKATISEAGLGKTQFPVLQDFLLFCERQQKVQEFQPLEKIRELNAHLLHKVPKGFDYYRDVYTNIENLKVLTEISQQNHAAAASRLRIVVAYVKGVLQSGNSDKIKALLDTKLVISLINALNLKEPKLKASVLEVFCEISSVFAEKSEEVRSQRPEIEEVTRTLGILTHMRDSSEDQLDRARFLDCSNEYFRFNRRVLHDFLLKLAEVFESPAIISPLFSGLKDSQEPISNKLVILKTFHNLLRAPAAVLRNLTNCAMDVFPTIFKFLVAKKTGRNDEIKEKRGKSKEIGNRGNSQGNQGNSQAIQGKSQGDQGIIAEFTDQKTKNSKNLQKSGAESLISCVLAIMQRISQDCRPEIIKILEETPGIRALLREQALEIPLKLSVSYLFSLIQELKSLFSSRKAELLQEIRGELLDKAMNRTVVGFRGTNTCPMFEKLFELSRSCVQKYLSWLRFYFLEKRCELIEADKIGGFLFETLRNISDSFVVYGNVSAKAQKLVILAASFPDSVGKLDLQFTLFNPDKETDVSLVIQWIFLMIEKINGYHESSDFKGGEEESFGEIQALISHEKLRKYAKNLLSKASQALCRVLLRLLMATDRRIHELLSKHHFVEFFFGLMKKQYLNLQEFIANKTEDIQVIEDYVEEANFRTKTFEHIVCSSCDNLRKAVIDSRFLQYLTGVLLVDTRKFDAQSFKSTVEFLAFREFCPLRSEGLTMLTSLMWNKTIAVNLYKELLVGVAHNHVIEKIFAEVRKVKEGVLFTAGLFFFSVLIKNNDEQLIFLMKHEGVFEFLREIVEKDHKIRVEFPDIEKFLRGI